MLPKNTEVEVLMNDFAEVFSKKVIEKRRQEILERKRRGVPSDPLSFGRRCELLLLDGITKNDWLGRGVIVAEASEYDDLKHGVDLYVDFGGKIGVIGIDLTLAKKTEVVARKLERGKGVLGLTDLTFYTNGKIKSDLKRTPRFVVGINPELMSAMQRELGLSRKHLRADDFSKLSPSVREAILMRIYLEILLEITLYKRRTRDKNLIRKLKKIESRIWELFAINTERRIKNGTAPKEAEQKPFRERQRIILKYCMAVKTDNTFGCTMEAILGMMEQARDC